MGARERVVAYCERQIGCAYDHTPSGGVEGVSYNCSFLTYCAFRAAGLAIPTWQGHQNGDGSQSDWVWRAGNWVTDKRLLEPGDLVFFSGTGQRQSTGHVGVAIGGGMMIDSIPSGGVQQRAIGATFVGGGWPLAGDAPEAETEGGSAVDVTIRFRKRVPVRTAPDGSDDSNVVGHYDKGEECVLDRVLVMPDRVWGSYLGASTGARRYVSLGTHETCEVL